MINDVNVFQGGFRKLIAWRESHALSLRIYAITKLFPAEEKFGLVSQLRRAASSIGANLAEGSSRHTAKDQHHFYWMSKGSLAEVDNFLELAHDLGYINDTDYEALVNQVNKTGFLLHKLLESGPSKPFKHS
jgi:four helix bundle protein